MIKSFIWGALKLVRNWTHRREWSGKCSVHGTECPCPFLHNSLEDDPGWFIPYRKRLRWWSVKRTEPELKAIYAEAKP
jgi:hypothetical protein